MLCKEAWTTCSCKGRWGVLDSTRKVLAGCIQIEFLALRLRQYRSPPVSRAGVSARGCTHWLPAPLHRRRHRFGHQHASSLLCPEVSAQRVNATFCYCGCYTREPASCVLGCQQLSLLATPEQWGMRLVQEAASPSSAKEELRSPSPAVVPPEWEIALQLQRDGTTYRTVIRSVNKARHPPWAPQRSCLQQAAYCSSAGRVGWAPSITGCARVVASRL